MQISFSTTDHRAELKALTLMLGSLCGMTVIDPKTGETTAPQKEVPLPPIIPAADLPSTGTDTASMGFAQQPLLPPLAPALPAGPGATATVITPPTQGGAVQLDARGLPWDARIHSSTQKLTDKGVWQMRRGVGNDHALIERVEAELRATLPSATPAATNPAPVFQQPAVTQAAPTPPAPLQPLPLPAAPLQASLPVLPTAPVVASPTNAPALASPSTMQEFMQQVAPLMQSGKVTADHITMACMQNNLPGMAALTTATPEQIGKVWATLTK